MAGKDNRWLQLEVCRQFLRDQCSRTDLECRFAHPPSTVDSSNGTVTACFDFLRKRCRRENCKYFHPPEHIVNQLVSTGSNFAPPASSEVSFEPSSAMGRQDKSDRLEVCREYLRHTCQRPDDQCRYAHPPEHISVDTRDHTVIVCMDYMKGRCSREKCRYYHPLPHLQSKVKQQQVSTSSSMLSHDYRRTALPYSGQGAAAAAAAAAASAAAASAANPYGAAANPYDPATLAAYGGNSQAQQMMSEWPAFNPYYMPMQQPGAGLMPQVPGPSPVSGYGPQMIPNAPAFQPLVLGPTASPGGVVSSTAVDVLVEEDANASQPAPERAVLPKEEVVRHTEKEGESADGAEEEEASASTSAPLTEAKTVSSRDAGYVTTAVASAPLVCATAAATSANNVHASQSPGMWYMPPNPQTHAPGTWHPVPPYYGPTYGGVAAPPVFHPPGMAPASHGVYSPHMYQPPPPQGTHFYQPYQHQNFQHQFEQLPDMMGQMNVS